MLYHGSAQGHCGQTHMKKTVVSTLQSLANLTAMNKNLDKEILLYFYFRKFILQPFEQLGQEISNGLSESRCIFSILQKTVGNILKTAVRGWAHSSDYSGGERCTFTASLQNICGRMNGEVD